MKFAKELASQALFFIPLLANAQGSYPYCQILDRVDSPPWEVNGSYVSEADADKPESGSFAVIKVTGGGGLAYLRTQAGDFDFTGAYDVQFFTSDGGIGLPDQLAALALNGAYIWRDSAGHAVRLTASPSIRSDLEDATTDALYLPFSVEAVQSFSPELSGLIGVALYPGFDRSYDPRAGIRWSPYETLCVDLMYPESKINYSPQEGWRIYAGVKVDNVSEWHIDDDSESIMIDETRAYIGLGHPVADGALQMKYEFGQVFNRNVDFEKQREDSDVDNAMYFSVGVGGEL